MSLSYTFVLTIFHWFLFTSKGRNGHVPYRDSKLTRILQNSLGGNAKTAIICTLSPAQSHVEQSRNTLLFASCAKQVTNSAQVNVVMSEKTLVKLLQKELARLEKELRRLASVSSGSCDSLSALQEKERLIEKMDNEIRELTQQRDYAHSRLQNVQLAEQSNLSDSFHEKGRAWLDDYPTSVSDINDSFQSEITSSASRSSGRYEGIGSNKIGEFESEESFLSDDMTPTKFINKYFGPDPSVGWENIAHTSDLITEDICKEVQHVEVEGDKCRLKSEEIPSQQELNAIKVDNSGTLKIEAQDLNNTSDCLDIPVSPLSNKDMSNYRNNDISRNRSCEASITIVSSEATKDHDNVLQNGFEEETPEMVAKADNLKVVDELNHDSEKLEDREDKTETSNEENIDQHNDYSTTFREDYDLKDEKGEDNSRNTFFPSTDGKLECLQHDENFVGNLECQKQSVDNPLSDASSNEDESRICQKQIVYNHVSEDENLDCHKQIVDTHVNASTTEDENLECQKQVVEKHVSEDENLDCHKQNVDKHISEDEILECRNQIVENHVNEENLDCHKQIAEKQISEDEILECQKPSVDNHVTQDENLQCQKHIVDNHLSVVSSPDHENLQCEKHLVDNPTSVVVASINSDHFQCDEEKSKGNHVVEMERTSEKQQNLPDNDSKVVDDSQLSSSNRTMDFEKQRQEIIELWNVCNVPLEHRTYFFLLFKGEPSDSIYMEVEQRRLSYLKGSLCRSSVASSQRALQRERERLKRQILKKLSSQERESLYEKWGIALKSKKRRLQLCRRLWTNTKDLEHIKESAALVAKLVGFEELNHAPKEIFGLSLPPPTICRSITWQGLPSLLRQLDLI
ncbi:hypothetical protein Leryth_014708 [Lithospermum erythrorhizon]|nr:hypothetical protein Leryth_014708 [Lithospermum erythrorhizon]